MNKKDIITFYANSQSDWRKWLEINHESEESIWLVYYRVSTNIPSITWSEAVDEALCFGWIDSTKKTIDAQSYMQYFTKRKPSSTWSKVNKDKVEELIKNKQMTQSGLDVIEIAKKNGNWTLMDDVENWWIPEDLKIALNENKSSMDFFENQSKSVKKIIWYWIVSAKRADTKNKRIAEVVSSAAKSTIPSQFR